MNSIPRIYNLVNKTKKGHVFFSFSILEFGKLWDDDQRTSIFEILGIRCYTMSTRVGKTQKRKENLQDDRSTLTWKKKKTLIYDVIGAGWKVMISS
jgi:hypothetical protein